MIGGGGGGGLRGGRGLLLLLRRSSSAAAAAAALSKPYLRSTVTRTTRSPRLSRSSNYSSTPSSSSSSSSSSIASSSTTAAATANRNGLVGWYLAMIESRPVLTKSLTAGAIFTAADASSQMITRGPDDSLDLIRTMRMASYGMLISGPSLHLWFNFVSKVLPKRDVVTTFMKMFLGQTVYGPIVTSVFFSYNAALQGETFPEIIARLKRDLIPTFINGLVYWPACDFITFKFIPVRLQPLVSNSFSFLWTIYITYMASLKKASVEKITED
uniref:PXMP2/4 family protein 4 n=1 Tax=Ananas comosus var. bracteatus TaxID=296719 RepID=A0A6V7NVV5_ANACO|nr:unnamed protein product [Ananas comosus var. bracteatus]